MSTLNQQLENTMEGLKGCVSILEIFRSFVETLDERSKEANQVSEESKVEPKVETKDSKETTSKVNSKEVNQVSKQESKVEAKTETKDSKENSSSKQETKEVKVKAKKEEKAKVDVITLANRSTCPVKVLTMEEKEALKKKESKAVKNKDEEHRLQHLIHHLNDSGIQFTKPVKMNTGLYEFNIIQTNGNMVPISVDNDGLLYSEEIKFYIGHMNPGDEYDNKQCFYMTKESLEALKNAQQIPERFIVPEETFILNKLVDLRTLKEKDQKKRAEVFKRVAKIMSDKDLYNGILKAANGEPFRFAFSRYTSENEFSIVSSKRNHLSNLSDEKLNVSKEIWINFKDNKVDLKTKSCVK